MKNPKPPQKNKVENKKAITGSRKGSATSDSTAYYKRASESFLRMADSESKEGNQGTASKMIKLAKKADSDAKRQSLKGKPGYDASGNPIKKKK